MLVLAVFEFYQFIHRRLPGARGSGGITRLPIYARQLTAERRSVMGFIFGCDEAISFVLVAGFEGFLFAGGDVLIVIDTPRPEEYLVSLFHVIFHFMTMNQPDLTPLASSGRVRPG